MRTLASKQKTRHDQVPEVLDAPTLAAIDKADRSFDAGVGITVKEARELNRKRYQAWLKTPQDPSA